jgi:hypothetical protein
MKNKIKVILSNLLILIIGIEILLRVSGMMKVYSEQTGFWYRSYWNHKKDSWFHVWAPNTDFKLKNKEFTTHYVINSLGFREVEFNETKNENSIRIFCIGDSYTEGDGVDYEYSYPKQLESLIQNHCIDKKIEVLNAGVSGSDILYQQKLLTAKLYKYNPDILLFGLNSSDLSDIIQRGGNERFQPNGSTKYKKGPWYHTIYKISHFFRFIVHYFFSIDKLFVSKKNEQKVYTETCSIIDQSILEIKDFCKKNNFKVLFFITPDVWMANLSKFPQMKINNDNYSEYFNLNSDMRYLKSLNDNDVLNLWMPMLDSLQELNFSDFVWPINGHFTEKGYGFLASYLFENIMAFDSSFFCLEPKLNE